MSQKRSKRQCCRRICFLAKNHPRARPPFNFQISTFPGGLVVRIRRSHRRGRGSIPRLGTSFFKNFWRETKSDECLALCKYFPDTRAIFRPSALVSPSKTRETPNNWLGALFSSIGIRTLKKQITIFHQTSIAARLAQSVEHGTLRR